MHSKAKIRPILAFIDELLPILRLDLSVVYTSFNSFQDQIRDAQDIHKVYLGVEEVLLFFPAIYTDTVRALLRKLLIRNPRDEDVIPLAEFFTIFTVLVRGPLNEKGRFLYSLYNLSKTDLLSETEHALMIHNLSRALTKMGVFGKLTYTVEDAKHAAFMARFDSEKRIFHPGLTQERLILWMTASPAGKGMSKFIDVLNRLLKVCILLDNKASSVLNWVTEMKEYHEFDVPTPLLDFQKCSVLKGDMYVVYRSAHVVSLCVSPAGLTRGDVYVQCNKHIQYSDKSDQFYKLTSYQILRPKEWNSVDGMCRFDVSNLEPSSEYSFILYQACSNVCFPPVVARTLNSRGLGTNFDAVSFPLLRKKL